MHMCAHLFSMQLSSRRFMSSSHLLNHDRSFTAKRRSLRLSKVMKLWRYVCFKTIFIGFHVTLSALKIYKCTCPVAAAVSVTKQKLKIQL